MSSPHSVDGQPVPGQLVNWVVSSGGGSVFAGSSLTNAQGMAQEYWTLGTSTSEEQVLEVRAVDPGTGERLVFARFTAIPVAGPPATMTRASDTPAESQIGAPVSPSPAVRLLDRLGNPIPGATVTFTVTEGGGQVDPIEAVTDDDGIATTTWTVGSQEGVINAVNASFGELPHIRFTTRSFDGPVMQFAQGPSRSVQNGVAFRQQPILRFLDADGQPRVPVNALVTVTIESGTGTLLGEDRVRVDEQGLATFMDLAISGTSNTYVLAFSAPGMPTLWSPEIVVGEPIGPARALQFLSNTPPSTRSGQVLSTQPVVQLVDAVGAPVRQAGVPVTVSVATGTLGSAARPR